MDSDLRLADLASFYERELLENIVPFWVRHAPDREAGGYFTCLARDGSVYDDNKLCLWSQGRIAWTLAHLYLECEQRPEWIEISRMGIAFLDRHGYRPDGRLYYATTRDGRPMAGPQDIFAELSAVLGMTELARATADRALYRRARDLFERCWAYVTDPDNPERNLGVPPGTLRLRRHSHAMITLNVIQQLRQYREEPADAGRVDACLRAMLEQHQKADRRLVLEVVRWDGSEPIPGWMGRWVNPGHMIEGGIFLIHEAHHRRDDALRRAGLDWIRWGFERGWDPVYGGLFSDVDAEGLPIPGAPAVTADTKLWWQHAEALYGLLLAHLESGDPWFWDAYRRTHAYSFSHFADPFYGEWYGLLDRTGRPINRTKGAERKNCFHIGRNFFWIVQALQKNRLPETDS